MDNRLKYYIRDGGVAQVVQCLLSKYEALSSKPPYCHKGKKQTLYQYTFTKLIIICGYLRKYTYSEKYTKIFSGKGL
jgi:hypothetical protein